MSGGTAQLDFRILGPLEVHEDGRVLDLHRRKQRALLAVLLLHAGQWVSADALIEALWGERSPPTARAALQNYVAQLRRLLGRELIVSREGGYELEIPSEQLDLGRFEALVERARSAGPTERLERLREALALWRGPPLADLLYEPFADHEADRLEELHVAALEELIEAELQLGLGSDELERLETLVLEHPYRERLRGQLMLALYRNGRQVEALEGYRQARETLVGELGIEPGDALRQLEQAILRHDSALEPEHAELQAAVPSAARRKTVTVLFAQLVPGSELDPELLRTKTSAALQGLRVVLESYGASIEQRASEELMAVFGLPLAHEDDAHRAARAALELRPALEGIDVCVSLDTGEVLAGIDETGHGFVSGAVVGAARRLLEQAQPGEVLAGETTLRLLRDAARGGPSSSGRRRLEGVVDVPSSAERNETPLAGRREELATLRSAFASVAAERRARLLLLLGEAGIGKTRLAAELTRELQGRATTAKGRCLSYGRALSYWPLVEAFRSLGAAAEPALTRLVHGGATSPQQLAWYVQQALEQAAVERPLLLVLEDFHWAEPALVELVGLVYESCAEAPLLFLCVARPELLERHPGWSDREHVVLEPLPRHVCESLLGELEHPPVGDDQERILARGGGNPLFLEELSAFVAQGGAEDELPPQLQVLLQARLDLLPEPERFVLSCAALEGTIFHQGALEEVLPEQGELPRRLRDLARTRLVVPTETGVDPLPVYRFRHQLIRDAAYGALPKADRARLHEGLADWLARHAGERAELEDVAAYHLEQAALARRELDASDPALERRAGGALASAADRARQRVDYHAAVGLWRRSLALLADDDPTRPRIELELAVLLALLGEFDEVKMLFASAEQRAADPCLAADLRLARLEAELSFEPEGKPAAIRRECAEAIPLFESAGDHRALARAWYTLAGAESCEMRMEAAGRAFATAAACAKRAGDRALEAFVRTVRASLLGATRWTFPRTLRELERLTRRFPGEPMAERILGLWRAVAAYEEGRPEQARALAAEWLERTRREGSPTTAEAFASVFASEELLAGEIDRAERLALDAIERLQEHEHRGFLCSAETALADVRIAQGCFREALELAERAEETGGPHDRQMLVDAHAVRARAHAKLGELDEAKVAAAAAVAVAGQTDSFASQAAAQGALAETLLAAGELPLALAAAREAERLLATLERARSREAAVNLVEQIERELATAGAPA